MTEKYIAKRVLAIVLVIDLILIGAMSAWALNINYEGSGGAPVSVGSSVAAEVLPASTARYSWTIYSESSDLRCMAGGADGSAPSTEPTSTIGFIIKAGQYVTWQVEPGSGRRTVNLRLDCIAAPTVGQTAPTDVDTWEDE
jgi:hypothetical protein